MLSNARDAAGDRQTLSKSKNPCALLIAGVPPWMARRALLGAAAAAVTSDNLTSGWNLGGVFSWFGLRRGLFLHDPKRGLTDAGEALGGADQIDAWEDHFGMART
jgi:hypothetical protein